MKISIGSRWSSSNYQNIYRLSTHNHLMIMIRRWAERHYGHLMITTILIDYLINILSTDDLGLKITSDNKSLSDQSIKNSRWSSDDCLSIDILTSYDQLIFLCWNISSDCTWSKDIKKKTYFEHMAIRWWWLEDLQKQQMSIRLLLEYWYIFIIRSTYDLGLKISSDSIWS